MQGVHTSREGKGSNYVATLLQGESIVRMYKAPLNIFLTLSGWAPVHLCYPSGKDPLQKELQVLCYVVLLWNLRRRRRRQLRERR